MSRTFSTCLFFLGQRCTGSFLRGLFDPDGEIEVSRGPVGSGVSLFSETEAGAGPDSRRHSDQQLFPFSVSQNGNWFLDPLAGLITRHREFREEIRSLGLDPVTSEEAGQEPFEPPPRLLEETASQRRSIESLPLRGLTPERSREDGPAWPHDEHAAKDEPASAEEGLLEEPIVEPETHALEFSSELVEDGAREGIAEDILEDVLLAISESCIPRWKACSSEAIILAALLWIDQDPVGLTDLLEPLLGLSVSPVAVGMVLERETAVGPLDLLRDRLGRDP